MTVSPTYPGVYIHEVPSQVRTIAGVATSITAFVGTARKGPADEPVRISSFGDFERRFGGLSYDHTLSYSVYHYFQNGGKDAIIVRVAGESAPALYALPAGGTGTFTIAAASPGSWGNNLRLSVDLDTEPAGGFNLRVDELDEDGDVVRTETWRNLSVSPSSARYVTRVLERSDLVRIPDGTDITAETPLPAAVENFVTHTDGTDATVDAAALLGTESARTGLYALENTDLFNLLVIPPLSRDGLGGETYPDYLDDVVSYCVKRRAILLVDPLSAWGTAQAAAEAMADAATGLSDAVSPNAAIYFPRILAADPRLDGAVVEFSPTGAIAGVIARTDATRGVWKAPAGIEAKVVGSRGAAITLTDSDSGLLNPLGINCVRDFPLVGSVVWGSRTGEGADRLASQWKYLPVRRLALYIEESLFRGIKWAVFEPNDEPLWAQLRLNVGSFMHTLFRQGAFQGSNPNDAYLVKCDAETTTQNDIDRGIVNLVVGFAPLKPAEFVIIHLQQLAGQAGA
jgi:phage tail sheath protein FI